jgi:hypothetical protein
MGDNSLEKPLSSRDQRAKQERHIRAPSKNRDLITCEQMIKNETKTDISEELFILIF